MAAMIDLFILHALLAGVGIALVAGPLGCFVAWRRLAYFGDAMAHAALLGVVLALLLGQGIALGLAAVAVVVTLAVYRLERHALLATDTLLGVAAHASLALALVVLSQSPSIQLDVNGLLFGDILAVGMHDIALVYAVAMLVGLFLWRNWRGLMRMVVHADIAQVEGVATERLRFWLMLAIALAVALSIQVVGILLVTSLLIIPAAAVRYVAHTPTQMALLSIPCGMASVAGGLFASLRFDTPSGPSIILAALALFLLAFGWQRLRG